VSNSRNIGGLNRHKYQFDEGYQLAILALQLRDRTFMLEYLDVLDPHFFSVDTFVSLSRILQAHIKRTEDLPTREEFLEEVLAYCRRYGVEEIVEDELIRNAEDAYYIDLPHRETVIDRVADFGRSNAVRQSVIETIELLDKGDDISNVPELFQKAVSVGYNVNDLGLDLADVLPEIPEMANSNMHYDKHHRVPTLITTLDKMLYGGPVRGEICVIIGPPGGGKSAFLVDRGASGVRRQLKVAHITIGDLYEIDVGLRYAARLTGVPMNQIIANDNLYYERVARLLRYHPHLRIKEMVPHEATVAHVRAYLSRLQVVEKFRPDILIIDYPDNFKIESENTYREMGIIYNQLRSIGRQYNAVVWVGCQVTRNVDTKNIMTVLDRFVVADSFRKSMNADVMMSVNQTIKERKARLARLWVDKVRRGDAGKKIPLDVDYPIMRYSEITWDEYKARYAEISDDD
jgi:hypothetical protein